MWAIGFFSCFILFSILYLHFWEENFYEALSMGLGASCVVMAIFLFSYLCRNTDNADYELIYYNNSYCHLTNLNYTDDRELMIETYRFPSRVEYEFSGHEYYRIDVDSSFDGLKSYWVKSDKLDVIILEHTVPVFKRLKCKYDKNHAKIYDYFLPKIFMHEIISKPEGILYLPKEPIYLEGKIPVFLERDFLEYLKYRDKWEEQ